MGITFEKIIYQGIFGEDFTNFVLNNELVFNTSEKMAVVYGPNGTGKTSLANVLSGAPGAEIKFNLDGREYETVDDIFHVINDQNNRNIISGETKDFLLGEDIRREHELLERLKVRKEEIIGEIVTRLKSHGITSGSSALLELVVDQNFYAFIKDCMNPRSKGSKFTFEQIAELVTGIVQSRIDEFVPEKMIYFKQDWLEKKSIIKQLNKVVESEIIPNPTIKVVEEQTEAIKILQRFQKDSCIVCDNPSINRMRLLEEKQDSKDHTIGELSEGLKAILERIINYVPEQDPFSIKQALLDSVEQGNVNYIANVIDECLAYKQICKNLIINEIFDVLSNSHIMELNIEYQAIIAERPAITDEDYLYISEIIGNGMNKELTVERDNHNVLRIKLSNEEFLGMDRNELPLSNGEQNFLSLSFEILRAKNSTCQVVVIDDPVSSFDSIYKNKVVYEIVKMLHNKKKIILTHNTDLIRLLQAQYKNCFHLYLFNNTDDEVNGFIQLKNNEKNMLINLEQLLKAFRSKVPSKVIDKELFLIAMIPFMRGYATIINNKTMANELTQVMHGYKLETVDIGSAYTELFGDQQDNLPNSYNISVPEILDKSLEGIVLINDEEYPLLNKTMKHSLIYLYLRLLVEKRLVEKFRIDTTENKQLGQIISAAYPGDTSDQVRCRVRLTAKKTLINDFNHFEGNLSIFQPAIDITDKILDKEMRDILLFMEEVEQS